MTDFDKNEKMIELLWKDIYDRDYDAMMYVANLIAWLTTTIADEEQQHKIQLKGFIVLRDNENTVSTLFICDGEDQTRLLKVLQEPPDEYKEKYVARVPCEEPLPVTEQSSSSDEGEIDVETTSSDSEKG